MNRRIRGKINSGEVGALYDNGRNNCEVQMGLHKKCLQKKQMCPVRRLQNGKRQTKIIRIEKSEFLEQNIL